MDLKNPDHRRYIVEKSKESAADMRASAARERANGNHAQADEDEHIARGFDAKARRTARMR